MNVSKYQLKYQLQIQYVALIGKGDTEWKYFFKMHIHKYSKAFLANLFYMGKILDVINSVISSQTNLPKWLIRNIPINVAFPINVAHGRR